MFTTYDKAVTQMIQYLKQKEVCSSSIKSHIDCYERYKEYLLKEESQWSDESVSSWLLTIKGTVNGALYYTSCNYIWQLNELSSTGCILDRHLYLTISNYEKLSVFQFQAELDDFLNQYVSHYTKRSLELAKNATAECLLFFVDRGCQSTRELSYTDMDALRVYPFFSSSKRRAACIGHLRRFLEFMSEKGDCSPLLSAYLDDSYGTYVGKLSSFSRQSQLLIDEHAQTEDSIPVEKLVLLLPQFLEKLKALGYSYTVLKNSHQAITVMILFFASNNLNYHKKAAIAWFSEIQHLLPDSWRCWRRALAVFDEYITIDAPIYSKKFHYVSKAIETLPDWCQTSIYVFLTYLKNSFHEPSTVNRYQYPCVRFCRFLVEHGMSSFHELTPKLIRQFCIDDKHSTFAGKAGYLNVTKQFIYYLEINHLVSSKNLSLCITAGTASSEKIVDILTEEQIQIIERFPAKANTKVQLRDAAMVMLSLKMGLRASDVIHLCFENIDWQNQTITIVQYKTKVELTLPMPTSVGNAIYSYLKYARPVCSSNYVFVRHRAPYGPLTDKLCTNALHRIVPERKMIKGGGFHVTRRTFATGILRNGYGSNRVMDTLGHTDPTSVMKYLSMDEESMRKCPLSLNELTLSALERGTIHE